MLLSADTYLNLVALWARRLAGLSVRTVVSEHIHLSSHLRDGAKRRKWRWRFIVPLLRRMYPEADRIIAVSRGVADDLTILVGLPPERVTTVYNPVVDSELTKKAEAPIDHAWFVPGAPPVIRRLHAEMFNKMGDKRTSLEHWRQVYEHAENDYVRDVSWMHVHDLTIEVDLQDLRGAVQAYRERAGAPPPDLQALVRAGLVNGEPVDPDGQPYRYDRATGEVSSASRFRLRRKAGA